MSVQESDLDKKPEETHKAEKGTIVSVTVVGIVILLFYLVLYGLYMSRV